MSAAAFSSLLVIFPVYNQYSPYDLNSPLDQKIPVDAGFPPGGLCYVDWEFEKDFERLDVDVDFLHIDTSKYFYLQFYHGEIGDDGFYFGVQNRVEEKDQMLIFSRWGTRDLSYVEANVNEGGFCQSAEYEGEFVGVRLPNYKLSMGRYIFSIIKDKENAQGTWYKFAVFDKQRNVQTWCGSIRFDKNGRIKRRGSTWTELYGEPWIMQTYRYLPEWDISVKSIKGDNHSPRQAIASYADPKWGDHIPMEDISYDDLDKTVRIRIGPEVKRSKPGGILFSVIPALAYASTGSGWNPISFPRHPRESGDPVK